MKEYAIRPCSGARIDVRAGQAVHRHRDRRGITA